MAEPPPYLEDFYGSKCIQGLDVYRFTTHTHFFHMLSSIDDPTNKLIPAAESKQHSYGDWDMLTVGEMWMLGFQKVKLALTVADVEIS